MVENDSPPSSSQASPLFHVPPVPSTFSEVQSSVRSITSKALGRFAGGACSIVTRVFASTSWERLRFVELSERFVVGVRSNKVAIEETGSSEVLVLRLRSSASAS